MEEEECKSQILNFIWKGWTKAKWKQSKLEESFERKITSIRES